MVLKESGKSIQDMHLDLDQERDLNHIIHHLNNLEVDLDPEIVNLHQKVQERNLHQEHHQIQIISNLIWMINPSIRLILNPPKFSSYRVVIVYYGGPA